MANLYEAMIIVTPEEGDSGVDATIGEVRSYLAALDGDILQVDKWGKRKLAYEVKGHRDGHFVLIHFEGAHTLPQSLRPRLQTNESVIRHMIVRLEGPQEAQVREQAAGKADEEDKQAQAQLEAAEERAEERAQAVARSAAEQAEIDAKVTAEAEAEEAVDVEAEEAGPEEAEDDDLDDDDFDDDEDLDDDDEDDGDDGDEDLDEDEEEDDEDDDEDEDEDEKEDR